MEIPTFIGDKDRINLMEWFNMVKECHHRPYMVGFYLKRESCMCWESLTADTIY